MRLHDLRLILNKLYLISGYLSGFCIVLMTLLIVAQVAGRLFGFIIPSIEDFSGYSLAAATFFGLAYTFREGGHIRVTLAIRHLPMKVRRIQEFLVLMFAVLLSLFMTFYMVHLMWESYVYEEVSYGYIPIPLWLPQLPVALGMCMFSVAILDEFFTLLSGKEPHYLSHEEDELTKEVLIPSEEDALSTNKDGGN